MRYFRLDRLVTQLPKIRDALVTGDVRALYLGWLACNWDEDPLEPPVPAGLRKLSRELPELVDFYELDRDWIVAANERSPKLPKHAVSEPSIDDWLVQQSNEILRELLQRVIHDDAATVQAESLAAMRNQSSKTT